MKGKCRDSRICLRNTKLMYQQFRDYGLKWAEKIVRISGQNRNISHGYIHTKKEVGSQEIDRKVSWIVDI